MISRLTLLLKGKVLLAILGTLLVAGGTTTIAVAATGAKVSIPLVTETSSHDHQSASSHTGKSSDGQDNNHHDGQQVEGTVSSIDSGQTSFTLTPDHSAVISVVVNKQTEFEEGLSDFATLKVGLHVEVTGTRQSDGSLLATKVEGQDENANDNDQNQHDGQNELNGTVMSIDVANSSFVLTLSDGTTKTVDVSATTQFDGDGGFQSFSDLTVGLSVEVEGNLQSNGIVAATVVHREDNGSGDNSAGSSGGDNGSGSGSGDGGNSSGSGSSSSGSNGSGHY